MKFIVGIKDTLLHFLFWLFVEGLVLILFGAVIAPRMVGTTRDSYWYGVSIHQPWKTFASMEKEQNAERPGLLFLLGTANLFLSIEILCGSPRSPRILF